MAWGCSPLALAVVHHTVEGSWRWHGVLRSLLAATGAGALAGADINATRALVVEAWDYQGAPTAWHRRRRQPSVAIPRYTCMVAFLHGKFLSLMFAKLLASGFAAIATSPLPWKLLSLCKCMWMLTSSSGFILFSSSPALVWSVDARRGSTITHFILHALGGNQCQETRQQAAHHALLGPSARLPPSASP